MDVVSVFYHPTEGMLGRTGQMAEEAQVEAHKFATQHYPEVPTMDVWTLTGWWLMEDDGLPFFRPKPWPIAFALTTAKVHEKAGEIPRFMILLASSPSQFNFMKADTLEQAREIISETTKGCVVLTENPYNGLIGTWTSEDGQRHIVAHVIAL